MPNWANGTVSVSGKPKDIQKFCQYFIFQEDDGNESMNKKYFARSFYWDSWENFKKEILTGEGATFNIDFAWSVTSCLIDGYPTRDLKNECITLSEACKECNVYVEIEAEEGGIGFEEHIEVDEKGELVCDSCEDMPSYKCKMCGESMLIASSRDPSDEECWNCDEIGSWENE